LPKQSEFLSKGNETVPTSEKPQKTFPYRVVNLLLAIPLTLIYISLIGSYWTYWDIGFVGANSVILLFFYTPIILTIFVAVGLTLPKLIVRWRARKWLKFLVNLTGMLSILIMALLFELWRMRDYPTGEGSWSGFWAWYIDRWF
jgi:hypothetical protein